jgi:hypothetical protein
MGPNQCPSCRGGDLHFFSGHGPIELMAGSGEHVGIPLSSSDQMRVICSVCLSCGFVAPYLERADLERLRARHAQESGR